MRSSTRFGKHITSKAGPGTFAALSQSHKVSPQVHATQSCPPKSIIIWHEERANRTEQQKNATKNKNTNRKLILSHAREAQNHHQRPTIATATGALVLTSNISCFGTPLADFRSSRHCLLLVKKFVLSYHPHHTRPCVVCITKR